MPTPRSRSNAKRILGLGKWADDVTGIGYNRLRSIAAGKAKPSRSEAAKLASTAPKVDAMRPVISELERERSFDMKRKGRTKLTEAALKARVAKVPSTIPTKIPKRRRRTRLTTPDIALRDVLRGVRLSDERYESIFGYARPS